MTDQPNTRCEYCEYEWSTDSSLQVVTCPSCMKKTVAKNLQDEL